MFTGLVTDVGVVDGVEPRDGGLAVVVTHHLEGGPLAAGESVAVSGCCLTVLDPAPGRFRADLSPETVARTGGETAWRAGLRVNLERALAAGARLGGHFVQGHVDGRLEVVAHDGQPDGSSVLRVSYPAAARPYVVEKGSIALDGVSLTVARLDETWLEIALIPETLRRTSLGGARAGDALNVEYDVLGKYVLRALEARGAATLGQE